MAAEAEKSGSRNEPEEEFRYYVHVWNDGSMGLVARLSGPPGTLGAYGWEGGGWVPMNPLWTLEWDTASGFQKITEAEAKALTEKQNRKYGWTAKPGQWPETEQIS